MDRNHGLRIGVVGLGKMGLLHATILNSLPNTTVVAICEKKNILVWYGKDLFRGITLVKKLEDFSTLNLDAVVVSTPIPSHFGIIKSLYGMGIRNLLVEKTLAANGTQSASTCELAKQAGDGVNMVGYMARYAVTFQKAKEWMDNGAIGQLTSFRGYAYSSDFIGIEDKSFLRGGAIRDLGCHVIDLALWYFGDLDVKSAVLSPRQPINGESSGRFEVTAANAIGGDFDISWSKPGYRMPDYGLVIHGANGTIEVNNDAVSLTKDSQRQTWHRVDLSDNVAFMVSAPEYSREDSTFVAAIANKSRGNPDFGTAYRVDRLIDQVKQQATQGAS